MDAISRAEVVAAHTSYGVLGGNTRACPTKMTRWRKEKWDCGRSKRPLAARQKEWCGGEACEGDCLLGLRYKAGKEPLHEREVVFTARLANVVRERFKLEGPIVPHSTRQN
ncbi:hypothetical protein TRVL_00715 [Trypanosoma vivax]|nr:hypothetical protein TRVL_00715 [Trypanosoma vivax]